MTLNTGRVKSSECVVHTSVICSIPCVGLTDISYSLPLLNFSINCYDKFELTKCEILSETYEGEGDKESATVAFIANMIQADSKERTAFMETSLFERAGKHIRNGAWLYKSGVISDPPSRNEQDGAIPEHVDENKREGAQAA